MTSNSKQNKYTTYKRPILLKVEAPQLTFPLLAGLIDGDGHIIPRKYSGEIRLVGHQLDLPLFSQLQKQFGGEVRKEAKKKAIRFFLNIKNASGGRQGLIKFVLGLNGHIRNNIRVEQFKKLCLALNIDYKPANPINLEDGYIAGVFISDGSVFMKSSHSAATQRLIAKPFGKPITKNPKVTSLPSCPEKIADWASLAIKPDILKNKIERVFKGTALSIVIRIANKHIVNLADFPKALTFGKIVHDSRGWYSFMIYHKSDILAFSEYMEKNRTLSVKHKRLDLVKKVYYYIENKANFPGADIGLVAEWLSTVQKWYEE